MDRRHKVRFCGWVLMLLTCLSLAVTAAAGAAPPAAGAVLAPLRLPAPARAEERDYLGVGRPAFGLADVAGDVVLLEIVGVYCPRCHEQAPVLNNLFKRLGKGELKDKVRMLAVAAGATAMETEMVRKQWRCQYPVLPDEDFKLHKLLGEPRTPYLLLVNKQGRVLYAHQGVIQDEEKFYQLIKQWIP